MHLFTTCRACGGLLQVTDGDTVHPSCEPQPTPYERVLADLVAAQQAGDEGQVLILGDRARDIECAPPRLADAALTYTSWGWPVFPLLPQAKTPATTHGFKDATLDPKQITRWWERHPDSNIGLPTGGLFDVIDIDLPDGPTSLQKLLAAEDPATGRGLVPDVHGKVITARGGMHLYIEPTGDPNGAGIMAGIDYRGLGGYVVAPPSVGDKRSWTWEVKPSPTIRKA